MSKIAPDISVLPQRIILIHQTFLRNEEADQATIFYRRNVPMGNAIKLRGLAYKNNIMSPLRGLRYSFDYDSSIIMSSLRDFPKN